MSPRGLEGVIATESAISAIIDGRLLYRGVPIEDAAEQGTFTEIAALLWQGSLPKRAELRRLEQTLEDAWDLPREVVARLRTLPPNTPMLVALREGISALAILEGSPSTGPAAQQAAVRLVGAAPAIAAQVYHIAAGRPLFAPRVSGSLAARFLHFVRGETPSPRETRALDQALILYADHELNASTFTARVVASTQADIYSAIIAALCTLRGPLHGGAAAEVWRFLEEIDGPDDAERAVDAMLLARRRVPGFGHRVYKGIDPRAILFRQLTLELGDDNGWVAAADAVSQVMEARLGLLPNVDFYAMPFMERLGLGRELGSAVFALGRMAGWTAHVLEQYANNKLIRPRAQYTGPTDQTWISVDRR